MKFREVPLEEVLKKKNLEEFLNHSKENVAKEVSSKIRF